MDNNKNSFLGLSLVTTILFTLSLPTLVFAKEVQIVLSFICFFMTIILAYKAYSLHLKTYTVIFALIAFIINPIFVVLLEVYKMELVDFICAVIIFILSIGISSKSHKLN
jgi:hypothetical protein